MKGIEQIPELTRVSSKGQVVIPKNIRKKLNIKKGSVFAMTAPKKDMLILKRIDNRLLEEDLAILKSVEKAWKEVERGEYKTYTKEEFFKELAKW